MCFYTHPWSVYLPNYVFTHLTLFFCNNLQRKNSNLPEKNKKESSAFGAVFHNFFHVQYTMKPSRLPTEMSRFSLESQKLWRLALWRPVGSPRRALWRPIHCKKRLATFPSSAGMSLSKLSPVGNKYSRPGQGEFGK